MIRIFKSEDIKQVMEIWLESNKDAHFFINDDYWQSNFDFVQQQILQAEVFVYETGGKIKGFIGVMDGYIAGIFVDKEYRCTVAGKRLLDHVKQRYNLLSLNVYRNNRGAVSFYLRENFSVISEDKDEDTGEIEYTMIWKRNKICD